MFAISEDVVDLAARPPSLNAVGTPVVSAEDQRHGRTTRNCAANE